MSRKTAVLHLFLYFGLVFGAPANITEPQTNNTVAKNDVTTFSPVTVKFEKPYVAASTLKGCTIVADDDVTLEIKNHLANGAHLIKYHLTFKDPDMIFKGKNSSLMYRPLYWVRSTGRHGAGLLLLKPNYDMLSLTTLELGVTRMNVDLTQHPTNCLSRLNDTDIEILLRELVMNDFQNTSSGEILQLKPNDNVCNLHITNISGTAEFRYMCCQRNELNYIHCNYLESDIWLNVLFAVITLIKVLVILFSPRFVPDSFYRLKHVAASYIHKCLPGEELKITTVLTKTPETYKKAKNVMKLSKFREMNQFKDLLTQLNEDQGYQLLLSKINIRVKPGYLLSETYAPVGLTTTLYESFAKCKISERNAVKECCDANFLMNSPCNKVCTWYRVMKESMKILLLIVIATPWIVRVCVYYMFEHEEMKLQKEAASQRYLRFYFPGNLTLLLTPLHVLFISIYILLSIESCIFGVMGRQVKEKLKFVLRKCFRDMREMSKMKVVGWSVKTLLKPCASFGGIGICIGAVFWALALPVISLILAFYLFPTFNITLRLFAHFSVYLFPKNVCSKSQCFARFSKFLDKLEKKLEMENISSRESLEKRGSVMRSGWARFQQLIIIFLCVISLYSVIFLTTEFISFIVEVFVYTMMGVILNAGTILTYISLFLLLGVYGNQCFGHVAGKFNAFNMKMHEVVMGLGKEKVENIVYSMEDNQTNIAFRVKTKHSSVKLNPIELTKDNEGYLKWKVKRLCLFLSKTDKPFIPTKFYFDSCKMPFYAAPGELLFNYMIASLEFGAILLFLIFVLIVVMAFGDTYELSATNKLLATVAGGFLPFMLKQVVFKSHAVPSIDAGNIHFQTCLNDMLERYEQEWPVFDLEVDSRNELGHDVTSDMNGSKTNGLTYVSLNADSPIDLLIDVRQRNFDDFPQVDTGNVSTMLNDSDKDIGSTSLLDDIENHPKALEMQNMG